ncbi:Asp-tRNA(Asn)/Glu-tRNA(Gln) amidotransferase subunit GatC [Truepera radiovictrix]|jgi:aspartyl-tRNA(Asn)/glutamyl-tRNA(Gln) amidotransferase subunit C|uniref:Aspartyl/glutamyl-tRNA(Asn/Gln) amidotransferase subunit C n=1 Tax=Truepera radiovictrix (strain DSM 17093 / CIP 108686 / LMG 22925 / RQ-24) TaxID=649638 RepID=D7CQ48_TRURR|nr:Asp-tRNA(Asn)/Glu-tRNA(Gln) amidotransferase subunit GatC [Truepera radiovictrix]ADI14832.1 glutamyl-tRNA(Gln) amidotransferase, C subunit [Truepera radiovictrix DSM 17093]WMT56617.1 Asp-tRNA(Asn)/Glu-tRNA(Gln) amidotransferase subunit GatC [Truepera radiovictrix]
MLSDQEMEHLKSLARLELDARETAALRDDLNALLGFFERLSELDTDGVAEMQRPVEHTNVFREDEPRPGLTQAEALALAVEAQDGFFRVPRTVDTGE